MKKNIYLSIFLYLLSVVCLTDVHAKEENSLFIYVWYNFLPDTIIKKFEKETGIKVTVDVYESNQILEARVLTKNSGYDIVFPSAWPYLARQLKKGLYQPLDKTKLSNYKNLDTQVLEYLNRVDKGNTYAVPIFWGLTGLGYNVDVINKLAPNAPIDSWAMVFDEDIVKKLGTCGVYLIEESTDLFSTALAYLGLNPSSKNPEDIEAAYKLIEKVRPYIKRFDNSRILNDLATGEACIAQGWSADIAIAKARAKEAGNITIEYSVPKEGTPIWVDSAVIPIDATHPDNAHKFIDFLLRPEIIAEIANELEHTPANSAALPYLDPNVKEGYPKPEYLKQAFISTIDSIEHERALNRLVLKLKTQQTD